MADYENLYLERANQEWRAAVNQQLDRLTTVAQKARREALHSTGNYDDLNRLHHALLLLIRVRTALEAGVHRSPP